MRLEVFTGGPFETNSYLLISEKKNALIVDPTFGSAPFFIEAVQRLQLHPCAILLTHSHIDHIADVSEVKKAFEIPVFIHPLDQENLIHPGSDGLIFGDRIEGVVPDKLVEGGQMIECKDFRCQVIHTPGHSRGSVCFYFEHERVLISGDTLFKGTHGNVSFPGSDPAQMKLSLKRLAQLPKETVVYPGHAAPTTIGAEQWIGGIT